MEKMSFKRQMFASPKRQRRERACSPDEFSERMDLGRKLAARTISSFETEIADSPVKKRKTFDGYFASPLTQSKGNRVVRFSSEPPPITVEELSAPVVSDTTKPDIKNKTASSKSALVATVAAALVGSLLSGCAMMTNVANTIPATRRAVVANDSVPSWTSVKEDIAPSAVKKSSGVNHGLDLSTAAPSTATTGSLFVNIDNVRQKDGSVFIGTPRPFSVEAEIERLTTSKSPLLVIAPDDVSYSSTQQTGATDSIINYPALMDAVQMVEQGFEEAPEAFSFSADVAS